MSPKSIFSALQGDSWPELVRRYFALAATAALVKSTEASGGLDTALGALVGATPLSLLGPFAVLQSLTAGAHTGEPSEAGAARLPLVTLLLPCDVCQYFALHHPELSQQTAKP